MEYAVEFSQLAILMAFDDAALNSLFWIGANYHRPVDLSDTTGLSWREAIIRCLESVYPRSRTQPDPEPSPPSPRYAELKPEPTVDKEPETAATDKPLPHGTIEPRIATEPEPFLMSVQVQEPATMAATRERAVDSESAEPSSAHCAMAEGELFVDQGLWNTEGDPELVYGLTCPSSPSFVGALCQSCSSIWPREGLRFRS